MVKLIGHLGRRGSKLNGGTIFFSGKAQYRNKEIYFLFLSIITLKPFHSDTFFFVFVTGVCIPANCTLFIKSISEQLAHREPNMTLEVSALYHFV